LNKKDPKLTALQFNQCINDQNIEGLRNLMTEDHTCILGEEEARIGKETMTKAWKDFFNMLPDYRNHFVKIESRENLVIIVGFSTCSHKSLEGPALWTAKIENDRVAEWRIYDDTEENRNLLKI
jgi:ketosteroid isomerase-like protein